MTRRTSPSALTFQVVKSRASSGGAGCPHRLRSPSGCRASTCAAASCQSSHRHVSRHGSFSASRTLRCTRHRLAHSRPKLLLTGFRLLPRSEADGTDRFLKLYLRRTASRSSWSIATNRPALGYLHTPVPTHLAGLRLGLRVEVAAQQHDGRSRRRSGAIVAATGTANATGAITAS